MREIPPSRAVRLAAAVVMALIIWMPSGAGAAGTPQGSFYVSCRFNHTATDDPIVKPNQPGASHRHDFFGNASTNYASTASSLRAERSLCSAPSDASGYWIPTLYDGGKPVLEAGATASYSQHGRPAGTIQPFPLGLEVVAGNSKATQAQSMDIVVWSCSDGTGSGSTPPACAARANGPVAIGSEASDGRGRARRSARTASRRSSSPWSRCGGSWSRSDPG